MRRSKAFTYFFLLALLSCAWTRRVAGQSRSVQADQLFARALQSQRAGDIEAAVRDYKAVLDIDPNRADARSNLGAAYARLGRYDDAIEQYKLSLALDRGNAAARFNLAVAYYKSARNSEAAEELNRVLENQPENVTATFLLASCYLNLGERKKVIALLSPLEAKYADDRAFAYMLGTALIDDDQTERGQQLVDRIFRGGDSAEAELLLGSVLMKTHDYPGALKQFERAVELNPKLPGVNSLHGQALMRTGDSERAAAAFRAELAINPNDFESNLYLGILLKREQKSDDALRYLERALLVRPGELNVRYFIGSLYLALGRVDDARKMLEAIVKQSPDFVEAHVSLATAYYRLKRKQDGDGERAIIQKLNAIQQSKAPGAQEGLGPAYRGESVEPPRKPEGKPPEGKPPENKQLQ
jgi:tetratricopeptide (TPR) repeat protein